LTRIHSFFILRGKLDQYPTMTRKRKHIHRQTIVVSCPNPIGDVVMAAPTFECIRQNYPEARLIGLIRQYAAGVVEDAPWFDQLIKIDDKTAYGFFRCVRKIRRLKADVAIVLPNSFRSALIARIGGAKKIYGYRRNGRSVLLTGGPAPHRENNRITPIPMTEYYLEICRWLNIAVRQQRKPRLFISDSLQIKGQQLLARYGIAPDDMVVGLSPGAKFGASKCWPPDYFARLAELLAQRWKCKLLLFIGSGEESIGNTIVKLSRAKIINTGPDTVDVSLLKPLIQRCRLLVNNDTGPRHFAVAFDIPVVVVMGPTDPRYTHANLEKTVVLRQELECSPCHLKECALDHRCMTEISPEAVLHAAESLLAEHS
jgi:heptosyltransferase-2